MKKILSLVLIIWLNTMFLPGCYQDHSREISIAEQYGLAYAPLQIMKEKGLLEKKLDNIEVNWKQLGNTAAIREAMLAGEVDIGFMAIPPFLIGRDRGMNWKIISGVAESPLGLLTNREDIEGLEDIKAGDRIALPQPGSIQHILLAMVAERQYGNADRFDDRLVSMSHPDGMNALLARGDITLHFTSPPYIFQEMQAEGISPVISGEEAMGEEFTFIVGVVTADFFREETKLNQMFKTALKEAIIFINERPEQAADILAEEYEISSKETLDYITRPGMIYSEEVKGLERFIRFMQANDYLEGEKISREELIGEVDDGVVE